MMQVVPNELVELYLENFNGQQVFRTRVEDAYEDLLIVGAPLEQGQIVPIRVGTQLDIEFKRQEGLQEGRFSNKAIVEKRFTANIPLLQLRLLSKWEKTQERMFVRVPVHFDAIIVPLKDGQECPPETGVILNLSGGGFLLRASRSFELHDKVKISFRLAAEQIEAQASMTRFVPTDRGEHDFGFAFIDLPEPVRKTIIQFAFKRQIELAEIARE